MKYQVTEWGDCDVAMNLNEKILHLANAALTAVDQVIPLPCELGKMESFDMPITQVEIGGLVGITGDISLRLVLELTNQTVIHIAQVMYGFMLEGEMIQSFVGELTNMIGGHVVSYLSGKMNVFLTPPTVLVGQVQLYGAKTAFVAPVKLGENMFFSLYFLLEE